MGLSQGQKKRLYGEQAQQGQSRPQSGRKPQEHKIHELKQVMDDRAVRANAPAEQQRSKTFLYVAVTISLLLGAYVAFWVLPSYGRLANARFPTSPPSPQRMRCLPSPPGWATLWVPIRMRIVRWA